MFLWPTTTKRITSNYGYRVHPITKKRTLHPGIDIAEPGTHNIFAAADGTVSRSYTSISYGECIFILHNINGIQYETIYAHMRSGSRKVNVNQRVKKGQIIGIMGNTGHSTGQHLHFEIHRGRWNINKSNSVDPLQYLNRKDKAVEQLQKDLKHLGYDVGSVDGINGNKTKKAIKSFQRDEKLTIGGIAGKKTLDKIRDILNGGLTMSQYEKLKKEIDSLKKELKSKQNISSNNQTPSLTHSEKWEKAELLGLFNGKNPHKNVTREQLATVVVRLIEKYIKNDSEAEEYAIGAIEWAEEKDVTNGDNPAHLASRQQVITMIKRAIDAVEKDKRKRSDYLKRTRHNN